MIKGTNYSLFFETLIAYSKASQKSLISFNNPIRVKLSLLLDIDILFKEDDEKFIKSIITKLKEYPDGLFNTVYHIQSCILHVDLIFKYFDSFKNEIRMATQQTDKIIEHRDNWEYWLTNWHPSLAHNKVKFFEGIKESKQIWIDYSSEIRNTLFDASMNPPLTGSSDYWIKLRGKLSPVKATIKKTK